MTAPVPVRTLAHAVRLIREARQLGQYGIVVSEPVLDYSQLLARVREVVEDVRAHSTWREQIDALGVSVHEYAGACAIRRSTHNRNGHRVCGCERRSSSSALAESVGGSMSPDSSSRTHIAMPGASPRCRNQ